MPGGELVEPGKLVGAERDLDLVIPQGFFTYLRRGTRAGDRADARRPKRGGRAGARPYDRDKLFGGDSMK